MSQFSVSNVSIQFNALPDSFRLLSQKQYLESGETCTVADLPVKCKSLNSIGLAKWQTCQLFAQSLNYNVKNKTDKLYHNYFETNSTLTENQQVLQDKATEKINKYRQLFQ